MIARLARPILWAMVFGALAGASFPLLAATAVPAAPLPAYQIGDRWTYQAQDGFLAKQRWTETHEVVAI